MRLVLSWLAKPDVALLRLVRALKPGGCLVAEELDFQSLAVDPRLDVRTRSVLCSVAEAHLAILSAQHGFDPFYGRRIAGDLTAAGLVDVQPEGRTCMWHGGGQGGRVLKFTLMQLRESIVAAGLAASADVDESIKLFDDPGSAWLPRSRWPPGVTARQFGERPRRRSASPILAPAGGF